jgi:hypothetical protein
VTETPPGFPKPKRPWRCRKDDPTCNRSYPCASCLGARNKNKGQQKQRLARRALETLFAAPPPRYRTQTSNEETWYHLPVLAEVKSGQQVLPLWTRFLVAEVGENDADGRDRRPVVVRAPRVDVGRGFRPDALLAFRLSSAATILDAAADAPLRYRDLGPADGRPVWTRFIAAANQSGLARATGDVRPFVYVAMPDGTSDGLFVVADDTFPTLRTLRSAG